MQVFFRKIIIDSISKLNLFFKASITVEDGQKIINILGWIQSDNTETTIPRYNFRFFYVFKMAVAIAFLCENAVEAV